MSQEEVHKWRKNLPKGTVREYNTARHVGEDWDEADADGDTVSIEAPPARFFGPGNTAPPREVAEEIYGMVWNWARGSRERFALMAQIVRHNNPGAFGHLSDEDLASKLEQHAKDAARKATETVYMESKWDRGNVLTGR